ncbi:amylo-alpha-1,6-glucosidase [Eisenbergiella sp.]
MNEVKKVKIDIDEMPFSMAGSYLAVSALPQNSCGSGNPAGIYLRTVHGTGYMPGLTMMRSLPFCAGIVPVREGKEIAYTVRANAGELRLCTEYGEIQLCFADRNTLLVRGQGEKTEMELRLPGGNFLQQAGFLGSPFFLMNCRANDRRLTVSCRKGTLCFRKAGEKAEPAVSREAWENWEALTVRGSFELIIRDGIPGRHEAKREYAYEESRKNAEQKAAAFRALLPQVPAELSGAGDLAAYVMWSCLVEKEGLLTRDAMLMSKNVMCNVWSWDHCFNAIALSARAPQLAWDQFMLLFDFQDSNGELPDSVSDAYVARAFCKPPIHGWALSEIMKNTTLSQEQLQEAYVRLDRWTRWWLDYRDSDGDGICEYLHGHDSGWDNATVFGQEDNPELPDLSAFLILQLETLGELAHKLGKGREEAWWRQRAQDMLEAMLKHCFRAGRPRALASGSHKEIKSESLLLYLPLLLGKRLPEEIRRSLLCSLKNDGFLTEYGFATEKTDSELYEPDGYWRGPIWAPPTLFLVEGLYLTGEKEWALDIARRFCRMAAKSGFAENFNALTGEGQRDRAYTWTASIFLILAGKYGDKW